MKLLKGILADAWSSLDSSFELLWRTVSPILLDIVVALLVLAIGLTLAGFIGDKFGVLLKKVKIGDLLDRIIFNPLSKHTGIKISASHLIGEVVKWFLIATVLIAGLDLANLTKVIDFFKQILAYLPSIITAVLIVTVGSILANFTGNVVKLITKKDNLTTTSKVAVNILAFIAALGQLVTPIVASLSGFIGALSLSKLQSDILFIGVLVIVLLASRSTVTKAVESLYKTQP